MSFRDWIIIAGVVASLPVFAIAVRDQFSQRPGATGRMLKACASSAAILAVTMAAAYLAT